MKQQISPRKANTANKLCALRTDNHGTEDYWICVSESGVSLAKQRNGEKEAEKMWDIPKKDFNRLIDWYNREQSI